MTDGNQPTDSATSGENSNHKLNWINVVDILVKVIAALVAIFVTVIAGRYQSSMTTSNLLVQREQSDSNLRASMFKDLISPILSSKNGTITIDQELLLVKMLELNFNEHFELSPLLMYVDDRLANTKNDEMNATQKEIARNSLRSTAQRVIQQQLASLSKSNEDSRPELQTCIYYFQLEESKSPKNPKDIPPAKRSCSILQEAYFDDLIKVESPNGRYTLSFTIKAPDNWQNQRFQVDMVVNDNKESEKNKNTVDTIKEATKNYTDKKQLIYEKQITSPEFQLTWFDFPFTDNTLLADGTRFSLVMDKVKLDRENIEANNIVTFKLVWFPLDYFSAQERPTNHRQFREQLGLKLQ
jgi:hypothetical protein